MAKIVWRAVLTLSLLPGSVLAQSANEDSNPYDPLHNSIGELKDFTLTNSEGEAVSTASLRGKVWVAHLFFTTCTGGCTKTAPTMAKLQKLVAGKKDYALVSISLNHDDPADLRKYAKDLGADREQWLFLTGPVDQVHAIVKNSFKQPVEEVKKAKSGQEILHSFNLIVVDGQGNIRGYTDGREEGAAADLFGRMREIVRPKYMLPAVNAGLNFLAGVLLVVGYLAVKRRMLTFHKICMLTALATSAAFLASYLYFHFVVLDGKPTRFTGQGTVRVIYFGVLLSHTLLAAAVAPLALWTSYLGLRDRLAKHRGIARWTLPIWLYVSVTGVVVYAMLYHLYPPF